MRCCMNEAMLNQNAFNNVKSLVAVKRCDDELLPIFCRGRVSQGENRFETYSASDAQMYAITIMVHVSQSNGANKLNIPGSWIKNQQKIDSSFKLPQCEKSQLLYCAVFSIVRSTYCS